MQHPDGNSIICDYCLDELSQQFVYYSYDFYLIRVFNRVKDIGTQVIYSVELCDSCMEQYRKRVSQAYSPPVPNQFHCDISGERISEPNFEYYICKISKVIVSIGPYKCAGCKRQRDPAEGPCSQCNNNAVLERDVKSEVDDRYAELNFSIRMFEKFKAMVDSNKRIGAEEWAK